VLNKIWPLFIIISFIFSIYSGNISNVSNAVFESANQTVTLSLTLLGTLCLWNGIMKIAVNTSIIEKLTKFLKPLISFIFPEIKNNKKISKEISMNIIANILGLGNASTPLGLKAMESMQKENNDKSRLSDSMAMFILINTASLQIIPTTVISIRSSLGSQEPAKIIIAVWIATIAAFTTAIISGKILVKKM
jgi:spore maturation protein A